MLPFSFTIGGFIRSRGQCLLAARPQTQSDFSSHSTSPMGGGCLMPSAMSLGRDNGLPADMLAGAYPFQIEIRFQHPIDARPTDAELLGDGSGAEALGFHLTRPTARAS